jgi:hypothetical protein
MQSVTFEIPRFYDDVGFCIGGNGIDGKYCFLDTEVVLPFPKQVLIDIEASQNNINASELIGVCFGINDNSPAPPTLNFTGRLGGLMTPAYLAQLHNELTPVYGYPKYLYEPIWKYVLFRCKKANEFVFNSADYYQKITETNEKLSEFSKQISKKGIFIEKIIFNFQHIDYQNNIKQPFWYVNTENGNYEEQNFFLMASYNAIQANPQNIEFEPKKPFLISNYTFLKFRNVGYKNAVIDQFAKLKLSFSRTIWIILFSSGGLNELFTFESVLSNTSYLPNFSGAGNYGITLFYTEKEKPIVFFPPIKLQKNQTEADEKQDTDTLTEPASNRENTLTEPASNRENWIFLVLVLLVILLIVLQKASKN